MKKELYKEWLENKGIKSAGNYISKISTIESYEGDIDLHYDTDKCVGLLKKLIYTTDDMLNQVKPKHGIPISPTSSKDKFTSILEGTQDYKTRVMRYVDFRNEVLPNNNCEYAWFVGAVQGNNDLADEFIKNGYWENGYDDKYTNAVNSVKNGDRIAIKAAYTQKHNIPFNSNNEVVSIMSIKATGIVTKNHNNGKRLDVEWVKLITPKIWYFFTGRNTIWKVEEKPDDWKYKALIDFTFNDVPQEINKFLNDPFWQGRYIDTLDDDSVREIITYTKKDFLSEVYMSENDYDTLENLLYRKKNIILQGAPGVGKTFAAKRLAYSIIGTEEFSQVEFIQFHQSYSYEDFIMGFRPVDNGFELMNGVFWEFCDTASKNQDKLYFFIIDEINRGNLSKIFGELFMLIEHDKRGIKNSVKLLYSGEPFYIPSNVHIIGMMNTADRSLAMIDYALRRRFAFFEMNPAFESDGFKAYQTRISNEKYNKLIKQIQLLNAQIEQDETLGTGFRIGHSYFITDDSINDAWLKAVINYEILPLLQEYWFDEPTKVRDWTDRLKEVIL